MAYNEGAGQPAPFLYGEKMQVIEKVINTLTGQEFVNPNQNLIVHAQNENYFKIVYKEVEGEDKPEKFTESGLKCMSVKDLQNICESLEIECDRRKKDAMIDAILKYGR